MIKQDRPINLQHEREKRRASTADHDTPHTAALPPTPLLPICACCDQPRARSDIIDLGMPLCKRAIECCKAMLDYDKIATDALEPLEPVPHYRRARPRRICSFCSRSEEEVATLIDMPSYRLICNCCVGRYHTALETPAGRV